MAEALPTQPSLPKGRVHIMKNGERPWDIIVDEYRVIFAENPDLKLPVTNKILADNGLDARLIRAGKTIHLYSIAELEREFPIIVERRNAKEKMKQELDQLRERQKKGLSYEVVEGDSPEKIARKWGVVVSADKDVIVKEIIKQKGEVLRFSTPENPQWLDKAALLALMVEKRVARRAKKPVSFDVKKKASDEVLKLIPKEYVYYGMTNTATVTAYVPDNPKTALMTDPSRKGGAAVDFDTIPPRSILVVETHDGTGKAIRLQLVADDTGGDMRKAAEDGICHVDVRFPVADGETREQADQRAVGFGRRDKDATVYVFVPKGMHELYGSKVPQTQPKKATQTQSKEKTPEKKPIKKAVPEKKTENVHIVVAGDNLQGISKKQYGTIGYWKLIYMKNKTVIGDDPGKLSLGQKLVIPPKPKPKPKPRPKGIPGEKELTTREQKEKLTKIDLGEINKLQEKFRPFVIRLLKRARAAGLKVMILEGYRSYAKQLEYYKRGRKFNKEKGVWEKVGRIVTKARPGFSWHQHGYAVDIVAQDEKGQPYYPPDNDIFWKKLGWIGKSFTVEVDGVHEKLTWGGDFKKFVDSPHFQWHPKGVTRSQLHIARMKKKEVPKS